MKDIVEIKGNWWIPDDEDNQFPGEVTFSQNAGISLEIAGDFNTNEVENNSETEIILGISQKGEPITLSGCIKADQTLSFPGLGQTRFWAHMMFKGVHFSNQEDIKFNQLVAHYTDLDAWVDIYGFSIDEEISEAKPRKAVIEFVKPDNISIEVDETYKVGIGFSSKGPNHSMVQTEARITQKAHLVTESKQGDIPYIEILSELNKLRDLFQIALQRIPFATEIYGITEANVQERIGVNNEKVVHFPQVHIYFEPIEPYRERRAKLPPQMLFTYKDLSEDQIIQWFQSYDNYRTEINLYRTLFYSDKLFIETRFLNIAQALESLHSLRFETKHMPTKEFKANKKKALAQLSEDLVEWAKEALGNSNYKRFREKIYELLENKTTIFKQVIKDDDSFAVRVRDTRNEFVHNREQKKSFRGKEELFSAITLLTYLFEAYMLEIAGFSKKRIEEIYKKRIERYQSRWNNF